MPSKNQTRDVRNAMPVPVDVAKRGLITARQEAINFKERNYRWPTIKEKRPLSWEIQSIERMRRICDKHGISLFQFLTAAHNDYELWNTLESAGGTSVARSGAPGKSIAEAMEELLADPRFSTHTLEKWV